MSLDETNIFSLQHEGVDVISHQRCRKSIDSFLFIYKGSHGNNVIMNGHNMLQLSVDQFCRDMCRSIEAWLIDVSDNDTIQKKLADTLIIHTSGATRGGVHVK